MKETSTGQLLQTWLGENAPSERTQLPPEFEIVTSHYPGSQEFLELTYPALKVSKRGTGFTGTFQTVNIDGLDESGNPIQELSYKRFNEDCMEHSHEIFLIVAGLYTKYPSLVKDKDAKVKNAHGNFLLAQHRVLATTLIHDMLEIKGGDLPQSIPDNFYMNPNFQDYLKEHNKTELLYLIQQGEHSIINNGKKPEYLEEYHTFAQWNEEQQKDAVTELFSTIKDPKTAAEFIYLAKGFEERTSAKYINDTGIWLARWGDTAQETNSIFERNYGGEEVAYIHQQGFKEPEEHQMHRVIQAKAVKLSIGRMLEPAIMVLNGIRNEGEDFNKGAFTAMYHESLTQLNKLARCGYPNNIAVGQEAISYYMDIARRIYHKSKDFNALNELVNIKERWISPAKNF